MHWFHVKCFFAASHVHFRNICDGKTRISKSWETLPECLQELWTCESAPSCFKGRPWEQSLQSRNTLLHINDAYWEIESERGSTERRRGKNKTASRETGPWNMTGRQKGRQGRGRPYCSNLILRSLIVSCCSCLPGCVCWAYVKHISPLSLGTHTHTSPVPFPLILLVHKKFLRRFWKGRTCCSCSQTTRSPALPCMLI